MFVIQNMGMMNLYNGDAINSFIFTSDNVRNNSVFKVDDTHVINCWNDQTNLKGYARMFTINASTGDISATGAATAFSTVEVTNTIATCLVDASHFSVFWQRNSDSDLLSSILRFDVADGTITYTTSRNIAEMGAGGEVECFQVDDTHGVVMWNDYTPSGGGDFRGMIQMYEYIYNSVPYIYMMDSSLVMESATPYSFGISQMNGVLVNNAYAVSVWAEDTDEVYAQLMDLDTVNTPHITLKDSPLDIGAINITDYIDARYVDSSTFIMSWASDGSVSSRMFAIDKSSTPHIIAAGTEFGINALSPLSNTQIVVSQTDAASVYWDDNNGLADEGLYRTLDITVDSGSISGSNPTSTFITPNASTNIEHMDAIRLNNSRHLIASSIGTDGGRLQIMNSGEPFAADPSMLITAQTSLAIEDVGQATQTWTIEFDVAAPTLTRRHLLSVVPGEAPDFKSRANQPLVVNGEIEVTSTRTGDGDNGHGILEWIQNGIVLDTSTILDNVSHVLPYTFKHVREGDVLKVNIEEWWPPT
jgi:peroxiredoxin